MALFTIPILSAFALALNVSNHRMNAASEQSRLDAISLSLCHSRKAFLESEIFEMNDEIESLQLTMDALAIECLANLEICPALMPTLQTKAVQGMGLMLKEAASLASYPLRATQRFQELKLANQLNQTRLRRSIAGRSSGLSLELLRPDQIAYQTALAVKWPRRLVPHPGFQNANTYGLDFLPSRSMMGLDSQSILKVSSRQTQESGLAKLSSECFLRAHEGLLTTEIEVVRSE